MKNAGAYANMMASMQNLLLLDDEVVLKMFKVLIADGSDELSQALTEELDKDFQLFVCHNGIEALEMIRTECPDVLVLNMALSGVDGLMVLDVMGALGLHPVVLALLNNAAVYVQDCLAARGVVYTYVQPCSTKSVVARIEDLRRLMSGAELCKITDPLEQTLNVLGVRKKLSGYSCIQEAVNQMIQNPGLSLTKEVYPAVAAICGGTPARVERAIRGTIVDTWKRREDKIWKVFFPPNQSGQLCCPSNGEFLAVVAGCLK